MTRPTQYGKPFPAGVVIGGDPSLPDGQPTTDCCADAEDMPDRALDALVEIGGRLSYETTVVDDGPEWYFRFEEAASPFLDSSGNGITQTVTGSPTTGVTGPVPVGGDAIATATTDWFQLTNYSTSAANATAQTIEGWFKTSSTGLVYLMQNRGTSGGGIGVCLQLAIGTTGFGATAGQVTAFMNATSFWQGKHSTATVNDGNWHHIAATWQGTAGVAVGPSQMTIYIDGVATATTNDSNTGLRNAPINGSGLMELLHDPNIARTAAVDVDEMAFYLSALGADRIAARFAGGDTGDGWFGGGFYSVDGDDTTYTEIDGGNVIRVGLGDEFAIARIRLVIATETAGARSYTLKGATLPDFSDAVTVATIAFTATGSFTSQTVSDTFTAETYEYWQLTGDDELRYVYSFELFEASLLVDTSAIEALIDDHIADTTDAHDASAVSVLDTAGWFTGTNGETVLAEVGARVFGYLAHGNMGATETFDAGTGWHSGTFNANCVLTLTGATSGVAAEMVLELLQDGSGGWTIDLPASVTNGAALEAAQVTTAATTSFLILMTRDGGTTWYGFWAGGSGGAPTTVDYLVGTASGSLSAEIVVGTSPGGELGGTWASPTVDATHAGSTHIALSSATPLVESGSGSAGSGTAASKDDHVHPASTSGRIGPILITDTPAGSPLVFADLLQNEAGTDLLYADA